MTQEETIQSWTASANDAWDTFEKLINAQKYSHALFFLHLALEKILKALIIKKTNESPPPVHDLVRLAEKTDVRLTPEMLDSLSEISTFNVAARYDDIKLKFYKKATAEYTKKWHDTGKKIFLDLQNFI